MNKYHKIQTVFHRDPDNKYKTLLEGKWSMPEFEYLQHNLWDFTEKVDGTNIRICWDADDKTVTFGGRTNNSQTPIFLSKKLHDIFHPDAPDLFEATDLPDCTLYGEGYGAKIQKGGGDYILDGCDFILFDVCISGNWQPRATVEDIAKQFGIKCVPVVASATLHDAILMVQHGFASQLRSTKPEGLVMRPAQELISRTGKRVIAKLKLKDFA